MSELTPKKKKPRNPRECSSPTAITGSSSSSAESLTIANGRPISVPMPPYYRKSVSNFNSRVCVDLLVQVQNQCNFPGCTYDILRLFTSKEPPVTRDEFIDVWKTILYKRTLDIYLCENNGIEMRRSLNLDLNIRVPAPLGDLLLCLGAYESAACGYRVRIVPPVVSCTAPPSWTCPSKDLLDRWDAMMSEIEPRYTLKNYPSLCRWKGTAICLTSRQVNTLNGHVTVHSVTPEPTTDDVCLRVASDELFAAPVLDHDKMGFRIVEDYYPNGLLGEYCLSYVKEWPYKSLTTEEPSACLQESDILHLQITDDLRPNSQSKTLVKY